MNQRILESIDSKHAVPAVPEIITRLLEVTDNPDSDRRDVVRVLSSDTGVVADVLRLANSAMYGGTGRIASFDQAVGRLGIKSIRKLVIARSLVGALPKDSVPVIDISYFWRRSLATAVLAAHLAESIKSVGRDQGFLAGLLCDIGVVILACSIPDQYAPLTTSYAPLGGADLHTREQATLGMTHAEVSAIAMERWSLPLGLVAAARHHHHESPPDAPEGTRKLATLVGGAGELARLLCEAPDVSQVREICGRVMTRIELDLPALPDILRRVEPEIAETASLLHLDIIPGKIFAMIANTVSDAVKASPV
jgi:HD-like signal output (HDOD) protein